MTAKSKKIAGILLGAIALIMISAGASALITRNVVDKPEDVKPVASRTVTHKKETIRWNEPASRPAPQQISARKCDDGNVVGYGLGALAGGLIGNQIGDGNGKKVATVGGAAAGALAGGQYIPTRGVLCRN